MRVPLSPDEMLKEWNDMGLDVDALVETGKLSGESLVKIWCPLLEGESPDGFRMKARALESNLKDLLENEIWTKRKRGQDNWVREFGIIDTGRISTENQKMMAFVGEGDAGNRGEWTTMFYRTLSIFAGESNNFECFVKAMNNYEIRRAKYAVGADGKEITIPCPSRTPEVYLEVLEDARKFSDEMDGVGDEDGSEESSEFDWGD